MSFFQKFRDTNASSAPTAPTLSQPQWGAEQGVYVERRQPQLFGRLAAGTYRHDRHPHTGEIAIGPYQISTEKLVRVPNTLSPRIIKSIETFWEARPQYIELGMLHRRGILLYGKQGIGKTALISEICEMLVAAGGLVLVADSRSLDHFAHVARMIRSVEPNRPLLLLIEDIERFMEDHEEKLLSLLSGQDQLNNSFVLATTNHLEELPPRLINRPSRFDEVIELQPFDLEQRRYFLRAFSKSEDDALLDRLAAGSEGYAVAHLKELVVGVFCLQEDPESVLARLDAMIQRELLNDSLEITKAEKDKADQLLTAAKQITMAVPRSAWISGEVELQPGPAEPAEIG